MNQCRCVAQALMGFVVNVARNLDALLDALMGIPLFWTCDMSILCVGVQAKKHLVDSGLMWLGGRHHGQDRGKHAVVRSNHCPEACDQP